MLTAIDGDRSFDKWPALVLTAFGYAVKAFVVQWFCLQLFALLQAELQFVNSFRQLLGVVSPGKVLLQFADLLLLPFFVRLHVRKQSCHDINLFEAAHGLAQPIALQNF